MKNLRIYCADLEKMIEEGGCYDAGGSTICQVCLKKPVHKKIVRERKGNKKTIKTKI
jgi:hypothetical protein